MRKAGTDADGGRQWLTQARHIPPFLLLFCYPEKGLTMWIRLAWTSQMKLPLLPQCCDYENAPPHVALLVRGERMKSTVLVLG